MRNLVIEISEKAKAENANFLVIPQNGIELILNNAKLPALDYLKAIDAVGQEDLFYGYPEFNKPTPGPDNIYLQKHLAIAKNHGKEVLVTDYCDTPAKISHSYNLNKVKDFISFTAIRRELDIIPNHPIFNENEADINHISKAKNFLYLLNYADYLSKEDLIAEIAFTNYDLIILDLFFHKETFTAEEIQKLKKKQNGGERLVIAYMSIGEAEEYRYYWQDSWNKKSPNWLVEENPHWSGNFKVKYWNRDWKELIYRNKNSYLNKIVNAGFDGVYLDIIDAFQYFEAKD
ncbi:endo alpha-1,4 polygalactosaminidase [Salegentibacter holothuriorum]|nr:endo alpha-1,4 polygalactosaminidase [Salegentibacter holothuriorum]